MNETILRERLHEAVDAVIDGLLAEEAGVPKTPEVSSETVEPMGRREPFDFTWPADYGSEHFDDANAYRLSSPVGEADVIVGWTTRYAWTRDRRRAVVFHLVTPERWYPWTEFVETDKGGFGAPIADPNHPRAILKDGQPLPARFNGKRVERADAVFDSIRSGASLRLVVDREDEAEMVRHGFWVAQLRRRI